ncbi:MAG: hypothetical protein FWG17_07470 [Desulfovibrionaceae bacterium]|nr:hypothetical protein [Desulfovibrionaceae bacterium]
MKKISLILALAVALAAPSALASVSTSFSAPTEDSIRLMEASRKVQEKAAAGASQEEIAAAAEEVKKIYDEIRAKEEAEIARLKQLGENGE